MSSLSVGRVVARRVLSVALTVLLALSVLGCRSAERAAPAKELASSSPAGLVSAVAPVVAAGEVLAGGGAVTLPRSPALVTTLTVTLAVSSVTDATRKVREEVSRVGGYVANMSASGERGDQRASLSLRVPAPHLRELRTALSTLGETKNEEERVEDVGEERADRQARLTNARAEERRLLELLSNRTGTLAEVLAAERELSRVRETIERFEARVAEIEGKIAFSTVTVSLVPSAAAQSEAASSRIAKATRDGFRYAGVVLVGLAVGLAEVGPTLFAFGVLVGLFVVVIRALMRRARGRLAQGDATLGATVR